ncbi:branched-chain amino acid aminotransferase [Hymenobacter luteus]|uniref:Branched-chain amino acid aminotransferase n=2 Tax=Hymenobacter TaxID=89966 RepID=A0A7W9WC50_9BACT|nr:aminotransferase class IV [Hymenobacter latericoloratus]MBB4601878.1 branched-chain amino acid aminotransferase [Hymenobacter latericoloratus]MBB6059693.1 branched-chain amino acid aminotransferase [Hymenobacter luteus]
MLLYNGQLHPDDHFALPLPNRGLYFNDGFFETMVWANGTLRYLPQHWQRLQAAAAALGFILPPPLASAPALAATIGHFVQQHAQYAPTAAARVRLQLWRGGGGLYAPTTSQPDWLVTLQPFAEHSAPISRAAFAHSVRVTASPVSFCKGPNALTYVLAAREREQRHLPEVLLLSGTGHVAEAVAAAVAWIRNNTIYCPALSTGCVLGTRLGHLRQVARQLRVDWQEGLFTPDELLAAEAVFTANVAGIRAVQQVEGVAFQSEQHPLLVRLRGAEAAAG